VSKIHAMSLIDFLGTKTLAYEDTFKKRKAPAQVCFWGTGQKEPAAKNMYRNSAIARKVDKLIDRAILFFINFRHLL
jgi:hypothetical protein